MSEADRIIVDRLIAALLAASVLGLLLWRRRAFWNPAFRYLRTHRPPARPAFAGFSALTPELNTPDKADAMTLLSERIAKLYEEANEATKAQEAKASTILGFVGGGAGLYALAVESKAAAHPAFSWLLATGIALLVLTLVATLLCLAGRPRRGLDALREEFVDPETLNDPAVTKARVAGYLFVRMSDRYDAYRRINLAKGYYIEAAQQLFAFGVIALVANYGVLVSAKTAPAKPTTVHCSLTAAAAQPYADCTITEGAP